MRHNKTGKLNLWTIARLSILALCFVVAFAFALTSDVFDGSGANAKIALAGDVTASAGTAAAIVSDSEITANSFGFPGTAAGTSEWTGTFPSSTTAFSASNLNTYAKMGRGTGAPDGVNITYDETSAGYGSITATVAGNNAREGWLYTALNFDPFASSFMQKMLVNAAVVTVYANVSVTANTYGTHNNSEGVPTVWATAQAVSGLQTGENVSGWADTQIATGYYSGNTPSTWGTFTSGWIQLSPTNRYIAVKLHSHHGKSSGTAYSTFSHTLLFKNINVQYKIVLKNSWTDNSSQIIMDGASPQCVSFANYGGAGGFYNPTTANTGSGWAYFPGGDPSGTLGAAINSVKTAYNSAVDSVPGDAKGTTGSTAKLYSYVDNRLSTQGGDRIVYGGSDYYFKRISLTFKDYYDYAGSGNPIAGDSCDIWYASGLKSLKVGITTLDVSAGTTIGLTPFNVTTTAGDVQGGQFEVSRTNRVNLTVTIYIRINCKIDVQVTDFGGATSSNRIVDVKGIDGTAPVDTPTMDTTDNTAAVYTAGFTGWNSIVWTTTSTFSVPMNQNEDLDDGAVPYMWFYSVQKADTPQAASALTPTVWNEDALRSKVPFAVKNLASFDYDFINGVASPTFNSNGTIKYGVGGQNGEDVTGPGYYLFTFYTMDMCGNAGAYSISYFVKADYLAPQNNLSLLNGERTIAANGDWGSVDTLRVTLNQTAINLSGNTLLFNDYNGDAHSVAVNGTGSFADPYHIISVDGVGMSACNSCTVLNGAYQIIINYSYTAPNGINPASAVWEIIFGSNKHPGTDNYENISYATTFTLIVGTDPEPDRPVDYCDKGDPIYDTDGTTLLHYKWQYLSGKKYYDGVYIRLDRNAPETPQIYDSNVNNEYFVESAMTLSDGVYSVDTYSPGEMRSWLNAWTCASTVSFSESLINEFPADIKVYIAMKNIVYFNGESNDYLTLKNSAAGSSVNNFYIDYQNANRSNTTAFYNFDNVNILTGAELATGSYNSSVNMLAGLGAGLRVFYIWSVDQAGNYSELGVHYVFVDNNTYYVKSEVNNGIFAPSTGSVAVGGSRLSIKRGAFYENSYNLAEGYAPYKLLSSSNGVVSELWTTEDPTSFSQSSQGKVASINGTDFSLYFDKSEDYGSMKSSGGESNDILITFYYRRVIDFAVTNTTVKYAGGATVVPYSVNVEAARAFMQYLFTGNGTTIFNEEEAVNTFPTNVGNYKLSMWIEDENYITARDFSNQELNYTIAKADLIVTAVSSTNEYGSLQTLDYTVSGLVGGDIWSKPWNVSVLILQNATAEEIAAGYNTYPVGLYRIVLGKDGEGVEWDLSSASSLEEGSEFTISNYKVTFVGAYHNVSKQVITVLLAPNQKKTFGAADDNFCFYVETDSLPSSIYSVGMTNEELIANLVGANGVFKNAEYMDIETNRFYMRAASDVSLIRRNAGENVGTYAFTSYADNFDLDENYSVVIDVSTPIYYTIEQRTVVLTPFNGQVLSSNTEGNYEISFGFSAEADSVYGEYLTKGFKLSDSPIGSPTSDDNFVYSIYTIVTDTNNSIVEDTANVRFTTSSTTTQVTVKQVKTSPEKIVVTISAKAGQSFVYGQDFGSNGTVSNVTYNSTDYNIAFSSGTMPENSTIYWTATLCKNGSAAVKNADGYFNVGGYTTQITSAQIWIDGVLSADYIVSVAPYTVNFTPAAVAVTPSAVITSKAYGQLDSVYSVGFNAVGSGNFVSKNFATIISGTFIRGIYAADGTYLRAAGRFDYASNANGEFTENGLIRHYRIGVGATFTSSDPNFYATVNEEALDAVRLTISPASIELSQSDFYGKNKVFDSNTQVKYATGEKHSVVNLSAYLVRSTDIVYVDFDANYNSPEAGSGKMITFNNLSLGGAQAQNYVLYFAGTPITPEDSYVVTTLPDGSPIEITVAPFTLIKSYFSFTKEYDGTTAMTKNNISMSSECRLYGTPFILEPTTINFASPSVIANYATNVTLFFAGITSELVFDEDNSETGISVEYVISPTVGMRVTILNLSGSITKKTISLDDITALNAVSRKYNGTSDISIEYGFDSSVLGAGDTIDDIGLTFVAVIPSANIGDYNVTFTSLSWVANSNYCVDFTVADLNAAYSDASALDVTISKAEVAINVVFNADKQYSGASNTALTKNTDSTPVEDLAGMDVRNVALDGTELNKFYFVDPIDSTVWANEKAYFDYTWDAVNFQYVLNNQPNASVAFNGNDVITHDVRVSDLTLCSPFEDADAVLSNYCLTAYVYDLATESYVEKQIDLQVGDIAPFDLHEVAPLNRKELKPNVNGVKVSDKVYDASVAAPVTLTNKVEIGVASEDANYVDVAFNASFDTKNVGTQKVTIRITGLQNVPDGAGVNRNIARNYVITTVLPCYTNATISPAPLLINASVGSKIYDGKNTVSSGNISISTVGYYLGETDVISVTARYASYNGKDVGVTNAEVGYFEVVSTSNTSINYYLVYASDVNTEGKIASDKLGAITPALDTYYYPLTTRSTYVLTNTQYEQLSGTPEVLGTYKRNRVEYKVIDAATYQPVVEAALGTGIETVDIKSFDKAIGTILPKPVTIAISKLEGSTAFSKSYDGTSVFNGVYGTDYEIGQSTGILPADSDYIVLDSAHVYASYNTSNAGSTYVNFTFGSGSIAPKEGIDPEYANLYQNYACSETPAKIVASIEKLVMTATLNSTSFSYGSKPASFADKVDYTIGTTELSTDGTSIYLEKEDYQALFSARWAEIASLNEAEKAAALNGRLFTKDANNVFTACDIALLDDEEAEVYFKLGGVQNVPSVISTSVTSLTRAGNYGYALSGGNTTNFRFEFAYTAFDGSGNVVARTDGKLISDVRITKAVLKVSTSSGTSAQRYVQYYGGTTPVATINYSGFKNNDGISSVGTVPTVAFRLCTFNIDETMTIGEAVSASSILSSKLAANQKYLAIIDLTGALATNYTFELDTNANGSNAAYLDVVMSSLTGLALNDIVVSYNGLDRTQLVSGSIKGTQTGDVIDIKFYENALHTSLISGAIKNAGIYYAVVTVSRNTIGVEGYDEVCTLQAKLTINKATITISADSQTYTFDGTDYSLDIDDIRVTGAVASELASLKNRFRISVTKDGERLAYTSFADAGTYIIKVEFTYADTDTSLYTKNYNKSSVEITYNIKPAEIIVVVDSNTVRQKYPTYKMDANGEFEFDADGNKKEITYGISYTYSLKDASSGLTLNKSSFRLTYYTKKNTVTKINGAGVYHYEITYDDANFKTVGDASGNYYCGEDTISLIEMGIVYAVLTLPEGTNFASTATLERDEYYASIMASKKESELAYWNAVDSYMPGIADSYHSTRLLAIAQVKLMQSGEQVLLPVGTTVSMQVMVPSNIKSMTGVEVYYVNEVGGLSRISSYTYDATTRLLSYEAPYVSSLVFVQVDEINMLFGLPYWLIGVIGGVAAIAIAGIAVGIAFGVKKKKKTALLATEGDGEGIALNSEADEEDEVMKALPFEEDAQVTAMPNEAASAPAPVAASAPAPAAATAPETTSNATINAESSPVAAATAAPVPENAGTKKPSVVGVKPASEPVPAAAPTAPTPVNQPRPVTNNRPTRPENVGPKKPPVVGAKNPNAAPDAASKLAAASVEPKQPPVKKPPVVGTKPAETPAPAASAETQAPTAPAPQKKKPPVVGAKNPEKPGSTD